MDQHILIDLGWLWLTLIDLYWLYFDEATNIKKFL